MTAPLITKHQYRLFQVNGYPVLITGGGFTPDLLHRYDRSTARFQLEYVRQMGLNTVRLEGKWPPPWWFELTDQMGILVI